MLFQTKSSVSSNINMQKALVDHINSQNLTYKATVYE